MTYAQALFCLLEPRSLRLRSLRVLSSLGAKGAVVWGDNRAPWAQTVDVIGELMHPLGEGLGCRRRRVREANSCLFNMCSTQTQCIMGI